MTVFLVPGPFYFAIFRACWDCYDFEAAAAHEIGHLLGISHPDKPYGAECATATCQADPPNSTFYNSLFTGDGASRGLAAMDNTSCLHPWDSVLEGVPPTFPPADLVSVAGGSARPALMESFTTHNPTVCLSFDDFEALLTLYPVCTGAPTTPTCSKARNFLTLTLTRHPHPRPSPHSP